MEVTKEFLFRLFNSLLKNGFYILWSLVIPLVTVALGQGYEMLEHMIIQENWIQFAFAFTALTLLGFALWIIPTVALSSYNKYFKLKEQTQITLFNFLTHERIEDRKSAYPLRIFAVGPLFIFIQAMALSYVFAGGKMHASLLMIGVLVLFILYYFFSKKILGAQILFINRFLPQLKAEKQITTAVLIPFLQRRPKIFHYVNLLFYLVWIGLFLAVAFFAISPLIDAGWLLVSRIVLLVFFSIYTFWQYGIYYYIDNRHYLNDNDKLLKLRVHNDERSQAGDILEKDVSLKSISKAIDFSIMNSTYKTLAITLLGAILVIMIFAWNDAIGYISPLVILVVFFTAYLMLFDISYKTPMRIINHFDNKEGNEDVDNKRMKGIRIMLVVFAIAYCYFLLFEDFNEHRIRKIEVANSEHYYDHTDRDSLKNYFMAWWEERGRPTSIFLVAGQGGGSRAAAWTHLCLDSIDSDGTFMNQVFAFSTASGSSVGVNMKLAQWRLSQFDNAYHTRYEDCDPIKTLYTSNLFSNSFYGLLFGDVMEGLLPSSLPFDRDKNYRLQKEEYLGFLKSFQLNDKKDSALRKVITHHFEDDYLAFYYPDPHNQILTHYKKPPLFFINATHVQTGDRCVFSPVLLKSFSKTTDVYREFKQYAGTPYKRDTKYNLPMVTAVCQSQAFPIISAFNYLDSFGNLADGGIVENSGCGTLLDVYKALKKIDLPDSVHIRVLIIPNSGGGDGYSSKNNNSAILGGSDAIINGGVYAYPKFWHKELISEVQKDTTDSYHVLQLTERVTLARILNNNSINAMHADLRRNGEIFKEVKQFLSLPKSTNYEH